MPVSIILKVHLLYLIGVFPLFSNYSLFKTGTKPLLYCTLDTNTKATENVHGEQKIFAATPFEVILITFQNVSGSHFLVTIYKVLRFFRHTLEFLALKGLESLGQLAPSLSPSHRPCSYSTYSFPMALSVFVDP